MTRTTFTVVGIVTGGLAVGWLAGQVTRIVDRANVATADPPVTWLPALIALPPLAAGLWAIWDNRP
jgi:hypothetical protein